MWSSILFLLDKMIKSKKYGNESKSHEIIIAALKLLELISFMDIEEFNLHRWAFIFEFYGVEIVITKDNHEMVSPFIINPTLTSKLPRGTIINYLGKDNNKAPELSRRRILLVKNKLHLEKMEKKILDFLNYWIKVSNKEIKIDPEDMETLIQGDFIDFKHFINL